MKNDVKAENAKVFFCLFRLLYFTEVTVAQFIRKVKCLGIQWFQLPRGKFALLFLVSLLIP